MMNGSTNGIVSSNSSTRSEEHTSELQSQSNLVCRLLLEKKKPRAAAAAPSRHGWVPLDRALELVRWAVHGRYDVHHHRVPGDPSALAQRAHFQSRADRGR